MIIEDQIRDEAKIILGFDEVEKNIQQGTGQIITFNQLGFKGFFVSKPAKQGYRIFSIYFQMFPKMYNLFFLLTNIKKRDNIN
ncbi:hypothetical protein STFE110948_03935 [Streptobacillus felis]|uniref:hypothetical protein n=1 Tax=Streptobacillus felis TaxID=1384509 RepID=UPI0008365348|nr:hypothetical protein [Streptobacillus felis]